MRRGHTGTGGTLIDERVDPSGPCGIAYYKGIEYSRETTEFASAAIVVPRGATLIELEWSSPESRTERARGPSGRHAARVTTSDVFVVPPRTPHAMHGRSCIFDVLVLLPSEEVLDAVAQEYGLAFERVQEVFATPHALGRSLWVNELQHRYFFERFACRKRDNLVTRFLESEIAKEMYFLSAEAGSGATCAPPLFETNTLGRRAVTYVETHLLDPTLTVESVASHVHASRSTLERAFKELVRHSPNEYIRNRRLDEAHAIITAGGLPVGQVASLVGYANFSAFSQAFKRRFKMSPSDVAVPRAT